MKKYVLSDFSQEEKELAKEYIKKAFLGLIKITLNDRVEDLFEQASKIPFTREDSLSMNYEVTTIGNDILAAIGAARNTIEG